MTGLEACKIAAQRCEEFPGYKVLIYYSITEGVDAEAFSQFFLNDSKESKNDITIKISNRTCSIYYSNGSYILVRPCGLYRGYRVT